MECGTRLSLKWVGNLRVRGLGIEVTQALSALPLLGMAQVLGNDPSPLNKKQNMGDN